MSTYAADVTPAEAYAALESDPRAVLVDVRTSAEWQYVGLPDLSGLDKQVMCVEWQRFPDGSVNDQFVAQLQGAGIGADQSLYVLCRSGVRSQAAADALTAAGLGPAYNILDGFEGPHDEHGHRAVAGWKQAGLPWRQG